MIAHIKYDDSNKSLRLLDQRRLPTSEIYVSCHTYKEVIEAIKTMVVRGAPAIGVTAAWACLLAALEYKDAPDWRANLETALSKISASRPTAVNLAWAVERMRKFLDHIDNAQDLIKIWQTEAQHIQHEDGEICRKIGENGAALIPEKATILTHCNAGALATAAYGTALGVIRAAVAQGKEISVLADETRPLLQGSRLTAWELAEDHIPVTLVCDNACALLMSRGMVDCVVTGADRIAANGDTANKIGTYGVAIMAKRFNIPFYIAAPISTIDRELGSGNEIPIEERSEKEVLELNGQAITPKGIKALNFAFDVTPANLISGIITEVGILRAPYSNAIAEIFTKV